MKEPKSVVASGDSSCDVFMDETWIDGEAFREEAYSSSIICEAREGDTAIFPDVAKFCLVQVRQSSSPRKATVNGLGSPLAELRIAVMLVVEVLKDP